MKRKKSRLLSVMLALCMALALLPGVAWASGDLGPEWDDLLYNKTYPIPGGSVSFDKSTGIIRKYYSDGAEAVIPSEISGITVTGVGDSCFFSSRSYLTNVIIPNTVISIGFAAFRNCSSLTNVTIPASVTSIGEEAFRSCSSLTDVYYGGSESQWEQIQIESGNDSLYNANIHYSFDGGTAPAVTIPSDISTVVKGAPVTWTDAEPFIDANDRTMVPLRTVADAMNLEVNWNADAREAAFTDGSKTIIFPIDSTTARTSDGGTVSMDTAAVISNDRTYAPIRYLAEFFGYTVGWDAGTKTVSIE